MADINQKLNFLYDALVDNKSALIIELTPLILEPSQIENTNKFASLLTELKSTDLINPLFKTISLSKKGDPWLADFLYAAINVLEDASDDVGYDVPKNLISNLEDWILNYTGEISWKAANLLKFYESETAERIQLKKLEQRGDFFLTYVECILGLLRFNEGKYIGFIKQVADDNTREKKLREFCKELIDNRNKTDQ